MTGLRADRLAPEAVRQALSLLGGREAPAGRAAALRDLREDLRAYGRVREVVDRAPAGAADAFRRLVHEGPLSVERLLGRGWWGHGALPPPLDWLQRRALVQVGDGLVHVTTEAREGYLDLALWSPEEAAAAAGTSVGGQAGPSSAALGQSALQVEAAASVVVAPDAASLDRAVEVQAAALRAVAPTVAVSRRPARAVATALRAAGLELVADHVVPAAEGAPALPGTPEEAVGPRSVRALLQRAVGEQRQVRLQYYASSRGGAATDRVVDPWAFADDLLVGYCHLRAGERTFAVDRVGRALLLTSPVRVPAGDEPRTRARGLRR